MAINYQKVAFTASYGLPSQVPASTLPEVSFVGRSNVGKSTIMNKIFNRKRLVKVSNTPGRTQNINFFNAGIADFVDLPGYGYAKVAKKDKNRWRTLIEGYFNQDRKFALCCVLIDIRHDVSELDKQMIAFLNAREIPFMIVFTKADKMSSKTAARRQMAKLVKQLSASGDAVVVATSSLDGMGIDDVRSLIEDAIAQASE